MKSILILSFSADVISLFTVYFTYRFFPYYVLSATLPLLNGRFPAKSRSVLDVFLLPDNLISYGMTVETLKLVAGCRRYPWAWNNPTTSCCRSTRIYLALATRPPYVSSIIRHSVHRYKD